MGERKVLVIEIGKGVDLRGEDATKAACRAVRDAVGSNGLPGLSAIRPDHLLRCHHPDA